MISGMRGRCLKSQARSPERRIRKTFCQRNKYFVGAEVVLGKILNCMFTGSLLIWLSCRMEN